MKNLSARSYYAREYEAIYEKDDLGAVYTEEKTLFRVWAPAADAVSICFFREGTGDNLVAKEAMTKDRNGTWICRKRGDLAGVYYTYRIRTGGEEIETADPYAKAAGANGARSMVVDLMSTNPDGFLDDRGPELLQGTDAVICEISVADLTADRSSGVKHRGKYLGLAEKGTKSPDGMPTGLDYLKSLGITHVQLMPVFDFGSIDEAAEDSGAYNWGYDPVNYNVPEGSYSTDPFHGEVRIREIKQMIQAFHREGIGVIMDVVFNHTFDIAGSTFQKTAPDYYYRLTEDGYSDASACGNEIASEQPMMRKYIIDSVVYWAKEYHIDGFRFDLMGCLDLETMQKLRNRLAEINPSILVYGEGWTGQDSVLPAEKRALKTNISRLNGVGAFSDDIRDTVRGHVFYADRRGFVSGMAGLENAVRYSVAGAAAHPQVDYRNYRYTPSGPWAKNPADTINYISCHDNLTLWDKLAVSAPEASKEERLAMNRLGAAIVFTSQGIPFFLAGEESARTKPAEGGGVSENSYNLPLSTNSIKYGRLKEYEELYRYYQGLAAFRRQHPGLRLATAKETAESLHFLDPGAANIVAFTVSTAEEVLFVVYNANKEEITVELPEDGAFSVYIEDRKAGTECLRSAAGRIVVKGISCLAAVKIKS